MKPDTYKNPDDAPQISFKGYQVALTKFYFHKRVPMTRHSPEEPAFLEILEAHIDVDGIWVRCSPDFIEKLQEDEYAYDEAMDKVDDPPDYDSDWYMDDRGDPYYQF